MKIELSARKLEEIFDYKELLKIFKYFSILTSIDVSLHDVMGEEQLSYRVNSSNCMCEIVKGYNYKVTCNANMKYAAEKAAELGEPYIFNCGYMIKCSVPIIFEEKLVGSMACGPVLLWECDDLVKNDFKKFVADKSISDDKINDIIKFAKQISCENMTSAAQMLFIIVNYIGKEESKYLSQSVKMNVQQKQIAELLIEKKQNVANMEVFGKRSKLKKYPVDMEKELIAYVQTGDNNNAKRMLNDMLGEIFSISSGNLDIIKAKLYELTASLMRAAVDIGAPLEDVSKYINMYNKILADNTTFEELCYLTSEIMEVFMAIVYKHRTKKQTNEHLVSAINYIKINYDKELNLKFVSNQIFVNSYYLSHLFRNEMNMTFSDYLNKIRMEESIKLLKNSQLKIQEIANLIGYADANYFAKIFKKYFGVSPKNYMQIYK
ncbi:MAG: PocR ligand-binding domain-containing protein [Clostridia bacterium]|nr:PocR ligand-binding domain-containing protein [Clostridia bacterium]